MNATAAVGDKNAPDGPLRALGGVTRAVSEGGAPTALVGVTTSSIPSRVHTALNDGSAALSGATALNDDPTGAAALNDDPTAAALNDDPTGAAALDHGPAAVGDCRRGDS